VDRLAAVIGTAASEGLGASVLVLAILEPDGSHTLTTPGRRRRLSADDPGLIAQVVRSGRSVYGISRAEAIAAVPLRGAHGPVGAVFLRRPGRPFSSDETAFLDVVASMGGLAVELQHHRHLAVHGRLRIDLEQLQIEVDGRSAHLTPTEMRLLVFLAEQPGRPRTRGEILRHLSHSDHVGGERLCDAHVSNLRRKIERDPARPEIVVTRRGVGYALAVA
jgi:hypothetical protein